MEVEEEAFEEKIFLFVCELLRANKNKINFDEKADDDTEMEAFYIFHEGVFFQSLLLFFKLYFILNIKFVHVFFSCF